MRLHALRRSPAIRSIGSTRKRLSGALLALMSATAGSLVLLAPPAQAAPSAGANFIATGHDMDLHCRYGQTASCDYLKLSVDLVRKGSTLPVMSIDSGEITTTSLSSAGVSPVVAVDPSDAASFNAVPFTDASGNPLYSAIVVGSSYYVADITPTDIANINARSADFRTFFNGGGGILALSSAGVEGYYDFVPIEIRQTNVSPPFTTTPLGASYGITSAMINCCATHNSFQTPDEPVVTLETDSAGVSETIAAFDAKISDGGFTTAPTVTITGGAAVATNDTTPTISGTTDAPAGSPVSVTVGGQTLTTTVADGGTWTVDASTLAEDAYPVVVSITADGKTGTGNQQLTVDLTAPVIGIDGGPSGLTNEPTPEISGTTDAPAGSTVTVTIADQTLTGVVDDDGNWSVTPTALPDGTYGVVASVTDAAGNSSSTGQALTVDTVGPSLTIDPGPGLLTKDPAAVVSGTTDAPVGTTVTVTIDDQTLTTTVTDGGTWSVTPAALADGDYELSVSVSDSAGNTTTDTQFRTVDTTAPAVTITGGPTVLTNVASPTISGSSDAPAGSAVSVVVGLETLTTTVAYDGSWSVLPSTLTDATYTVTVSIVDPAGNTGTGTQALTVDTTPPVVTIDGGRSRSINTISPTITGTTDAAPGSTLTLGIHEEDLTATVAEDGTWSVTVPELHEGTIEMVASVTDPAGNIGSATQIIIVDLQAPSLSIEEPASGLSNEAVQTISGTTDAAPGTAVTIVVDGQTPGVTTTVGEDGSWTLTLPALSDGSHLIVAAVTDEAGNTSTASVLLSLDATPPTGSVDGDEQVLTNNPTPTLSGTTDLPEGSLVAIKIGDLVFTVPVAADGNWTFTPTEPLADGSYAVEVAFVDDAGNQTVVSRQWTIDTTAPTAVVSPAAASTDTAPVISGTSDAPAGSTVVVTVNGVDYSTTVADDGTWSVATEVLGAGEYQVTVAITDLAGNTTTSIQVLNVSAPPAPTTTSEPTTSETTLTSDTATTTVAPSTTSYDLAYTGSSPAKPLGIGVVLLILGAGLLFAARRRRRPAGSTRDGQHIG